MKQYRTREQFNEILESAINGNWTQAKKEVKKYGFYAQDLVNHYNDLVQELGDLSYFKATDLVFLIPDAREI
jgi:hypothetical protein